MRQHFLARWASPGRLVTTGAVALLAATCVAAAAAAHQAASAATNSPAGQPAVAAGLTDNWYESAPYFYGLDSTPPNLAQAMSATGQKAFDMSFILANGGSCTPSWEGTDPVSSDTQVAASISQIRAAGGDVIVSAGGFNGTKLGQACGSAAATAAAYQQVINAYGLHAFDFDLEEPEIENATAIEFELGAAQILQQNNPGLFVSITMPSIATGANFFGQQLLNDALALHFTPNDYTIMPFDGGFNGGASQVAALKGLNSQLMSTFGWSSAVAYQHEGFSGMNGRTDSAEFFFQADFQTVLSFAQSVGLGRFTFWSVNRDRQCTPPDNNGTLSSECSSVPQNSWDFTAFTVAFANSAPVTPPSPPPSTSPPPTTPGSCSAAAWSANTAYTAGSVVSFNGAQWTANQWNYDEAPGGSAGAWTNNGAC